MNAQARRLFNLAICWFALVTLLHAGFFVAYGGGNKLLNTVMSATGCVVALAMKEWAKRRAGKP